MMKEYKGLVISESDGKEGTVGHALQNNFVEIADNLDQMQTQIEGLSNVLNQLLEEREEMEQEIERLKEELNGGK